MYSELISRKYSKRSTIWRYFLQATMFDCFYYLQNEMNKQTKKLTILKKMGGGGGGTNELFFLLLQLSKQIHHLGKQK